MILFHATTQSKVKKYHLTGHIVAPVRGFTTLQAAMAWCIKVGRNVILEIETSNLEAHKLPDHHNEFGDAYWVDGNISKWKCVFSVDK